jgi:hypothetical protein
MKVNSKRGKLMPEDTCETETTTCILGFSNSVEDSTLVKMQRWHYYIDRGRLLFVEGLPLLRETSEDIFKKCDRADSGLSVEDCPKHFSIRARPIDLVNFAKQILAFYKGCENVQP